MNDRERIELIMKSYGLTPSQFADRAGVQRASVSHILSGRNKPSLEVMLKIFEAFPGLDMQWLMTGKGSAPVVNASQESAVLQTKPVAAVQSELFSAVQSVAVDSVAEAAPQKVVQHRPAVPVERVPRRSSRVATAASASQAAVKRIKEIRVYYTDGTYEVLCPER